MRDGVGLVTDSTAAIHTLGDANGWRVVPLEIEVDGRRYREGPELSASEFHGLLQEAHAVPTTLPPSVETFGRVYAELLERCRSVVSIHLSGELSETAVHARAAAERLGERDRIVVIDSRLAGLPLGVLCREAELRLRDGSVEPGTIGAELEPIVRATRAYFSVYTLDFLYLSGRLERAAGTGSSADDRPILSLADGRLSLVERVVGETTRVERIAELVGAELGTDEPLVATCVHAGERGREAAAGLRAAVERRSPETLWHEGPLGAVLCAHTGFDVCGVAAYPRRMSLL